MVSERRDGQREEQSSVAAGNSLALLLETALETAHQANICLLRNTGRCVMSLYSENQVGLSFHGLHPAFLYISKEVREKMPENFRALQPTHSKASWGCD